MIASISVTKDETYNSDHALRAKLFPGPAVIN